MEDDDAILGLTLDMPSVVAGSGRGEDADGVAKGDQEAHWEAFEAAVEAAQAEEGKAREIGHGDTGGLSHAQDGSSDEDKDDDEHNDAAGATHGGAEADLSDEQLMLVASKKEAKELGKKLYKRWKKLQKGGNEHRSKKHKEKKKADKGDEKKRKREASKTKKSSKRSRAEHDDAQDREDDEDPFAALQADYEMNGNADEAAPSESAATARRRRQVGMEVERLQKQQAKRGMKAEERHALADKFAQQLVSEMQSAQAKDEAALSTAGAGRALPLHRVAMKDKVVAVCRRQFFVGPLVQAGILQELSHWLYDLDRGEPAPYELRSTALDILLRIPIEGEIAMKQTEKEDLTTFLGLSKEDLSPTDLGRTVNALRLHQQETSENRSKCVRLLERLSRAFAGRFAAAAESGSQDKRSAVVSWKCKNDPGVASPFDNVITGSQSFQQAFMKPDPQDPTSYNNLLPWRPPVRSITDLSGDLAKQLDEGGNVRALPSRR